jgi:O-antigen ligase
MTGVSVALDRYKTLALGFALVLVAILPLEGTTGFRYILLAGALLFLAVHYCLDRRSWRTFRLPVWQLWGLYGALAGIGLLWAIDASYSLEEIRKEIIIGFLFFVLGVNLFNDDRGWDSLFKVSVISYLFQTTYCLVAWLTVGSTTPKGSLGTWNTGPGGFSTYLVTILPFLILCVVDRTKSGASAAKFILAILLLHLSALFATGNRQGLVVVVLEMLLMSVMLARTFGRVKAGLVLLVLIGVATAIFSQKMVTRAGLEPGIEALNISRALNKDRRLPTWRFVWEDTLHDPWKGAGFGRNTFSHRYAGQPILEGFPHAHAHNFIIDRLIQLGFPGVIAFLLLFWSVPLCLCRGRSVSDSSWRLAVAGVTLCAGIFAKNMTDDFFFREYGYLFWVISGALLGRQYHEMLKVNSSLCGVEIKG